MHKINKLEGVEFDTGAEVFDAGVRKVFITMGERGIRVRASRQSGWRFVSWQKLYDIGTMIAADFDAGPRNGKVIHRGRV